MNLVEMALEFRKELEVVKVASRKFIAIDEIPAEELESIMALYPTWESFEGKHIPKGEVLRYKNELYKVIKGINWQSDWTPDVGKSDFDKISSSSTEDRAEIVADWEQS